MRKICSALAISTVVFVIAGASFARQNPLAPQNPGGNPLAPNNPPAGNNPLAPNNAQANFPAWMKSGVRIAYNSGDSVIPNTPLALRPNDDGVTWSDTAGRSFKPGVGGVGITAVDLVDVTANTLAADVRSYMNIDVNRGEHSFISSVGMLGTANGLGEFWIPPARLRDMQNGNENGVQIAKAPYPLNGRNFDAVSITTFAPTGYSRLVYDAETGLMIASSTAHRNEATQSTLISHAQLIEVRPRNLPWGNDALPDWMGPNHQMDFQGVYNTIIPGMENPWRYAISFAFGERHGNAVRIVQSSSLDQGNGQPPSQSQTERVAGAGGIGPIYISPQTLARIQPNQVIDEDGPTRSRISFVGIQNNLAFIAEQRGTETYQFGYNTQSGVLSMIYLEQQKPGGGLLRVQLQLAGMR